MKDLIATVCEETSNRKIIDMVFKSGSAYTVGTLCNYLSIEDIFFAFYRRSGRTGFEFSIERMIDYLGYEIEYVDFRFGHLHYWREMYGSASRERIIDLARSHNVSVKYKRYP